MTHEQIKSQQKPKIAFVRQYKITVCLVIRIIRETIKLLSLFVQNKLKTYEQISQSIGTEAATGRVESF